MIFHLAIPSRDLKESKKFYENLGAKIGRSYPSHVVTRFFECQLVLHKSSLYEKQPSMYPRHFGIILNSKKELKDLWDRWKFASFVYEDYFVRHEGEPAEHHAFFLLDPSNNTIEFKWYRQSMSIFGQ